jgi:hypothetical protein
MFVGHYAAALAAKTAQPRAPLWTYMTACQLLDFGWSGLVMAGVEKARLDPDLPGSPVDLYFMPFTHSLPAALIWSAAAALLAAVALRLPWRVASLIGLVVFSHWALDLLVHRPDLDLGDGRKVGLALWNHPQAEMALEMGLVALAGAAWTARIKAAGETAWPALLLIGGLVALQIVSVSLPGGGAIEGFAAAALATYILVSLISLAVDRPRSDVPA